MDPMKEKMSIIFDLAAILSLLPSKESDFPTTGV